MKIGIDISQIVYEGTGVSRYTKMLVNALIEFDKKNKYIFFFSSARRRLDHETENKITEKNLLKKYYFPPTLLDLIWNRLHILPIDKFIGNCDIIISSDWTQPPSNAKKVTIVHDLVYFKYPETLPKSIIDVQRRRMNWVIKEVDLIIADSESTKQDLIDLLKISENKIKVIYPAVDLSSPGVADLSAEALAKGEWTPRGWTDKQYILTVGKLEPRKNIPRLVNAFQKANLKDVDLLIVGPKGWSRKNLESRIQNLESNIKFLGFVSDSDLYPLYSKALFFIYPSLYEGFGYPLVEAMSLGCPIATSNTSSLKEIGEGSALLFNPESEEEIKNAILKLYNDKNLRKKLSTEGKKKAKSFSPKIFIQNFLSAIVK